jgi:DNA sulfur modification protein DndE
VVEDVYIQDIEMGRIGGDAIQLTTEYKSFVKPDGKAPIFRNIRIRNVTCKDAATAARMVGLPDAPLRDFILQNITIASEEGLYCASANGIHLLDVRVTPRIGPVLALKDSRDVVIDGLNHSDNGGVFLDLRGRQTKGVRLRGESRVPVRPAVRSRHRRAAGCAGPRVIPRFLLSLYAGVPVYS